MSQTINLNILPNYSQVSGLYFSQNDVGRTATINLIDDNGVPYEIPSGATVKIQATKPSGLGFSEACTYEDNIVTVTCSATMTDELGKFPCEIEVLSGSVVLGSANFLFCVERNPHPNGTTDGTAESVLNDITVAFNNAMENIENAGGLTVDIKEALLACFRNVAWIGDDGQEYYDDLADALYAVTGITLNSNSLVFNSIGSTQQLTASLIPSGSVATVAWESSNSDVAVVSSTGLVTSVGDGEAVITASVGSVSATCSVTVEELSVVSISAVLNASGHTFYVGDNIDTIKPYLTVTVTYSDSSTAVIPSGSYTLSGSLSTAGSNTITVSYEGVSTTVSVTAVAVELVSITCVYTQSGTVYDTASLDSLKSDLVVTATYDDTSTAEVPSADYTLSGTLTVGTSTITVSYGGKTDTFTVTVTMEALYRVENQTVNRTDNGAVDSGISILASDQSFAITFDGIQGSMPSSGAYRVVVCNNAGSNYKGIYVGGGNNDANALAQWGNSSNASGLWARNLNNTRIRFVYQHTQGSGNAVIYVKVANGTVVTKTMSSSFVSSTATVVIGSSGTSAGSLSYCWVGTITKSEIYGRTLTSDEIDAFLA